MIQPMMPSAMDVFSSISSLSSTVTAGNPLTVLVQHVRG